MSTGRNLYSRYSKVLNILSKIGEKIPYNMRIKMLHLFRNTGGKTGIAIRYISFGDNVSVHPFCYLEGSGGIEIGNDVSLAHNTSILSVNHTWENYEMPIKYNPIDHTPVKICDDVWVGCGCRIMAGITINSRSIIAAGAVVTKDVESNSIVGGVPAKKIKKI